MMANILKLENPILINGVQRTELTYDANEIDTLLFTQAETNKLQASAAKKGNLQGAYEIDYSMHLYLGFAAIIAVNRDIDFKDLERIKGFDVMEVSKIGRNFIMRRSEAPSQPNDSESLSDPTHAPLALAPATSSENPL